jgi:hypothetical protein
MTGHCALCSKEKELQLSHIIPCFVFKWLKASSVTGHFRHGETINKRAQDGDKVYLLCRDCEQLLGRNEDIFAKEIFIPLHKDESIEQYGPWLLKFSTSVSWRVLTYFKNYLDLKHFPENLLMSVDDALRTWQAFLLNELSTPGDYEQHILPFRGLIGNYSGPDMPSNFNRYVLRSVDIDVACSKTEAFVYAKMCRLLLIGFIEMDHKERWRDTKVHLDHGNLEKEHYKVPATVSNFMFYKARRLQAVHKKLSERQRGRIDKDYRKHPTKYRDSEMFKAITQDSLLFGEAAFDDNNIR